MKRAIILVAALVWSGCSGETETGTTPALGTGGTTDASAGAGGTAGSGGQSSGGSAGQGTGGAAGQTGGAAGTTAGGSAGQGGASGTGGDAGPADAPDDVDQMTAFINKMNGIWLVGWSGGLNHYSWVRITSSSPGSLIGKAEFLSGADLNVNAPFWNCTGTGSFMTPAKPYSILFTFPSTCPSGLEQEYTFDPFFAPGSWPNGAILAATVTPLSGTSTLEGYKFPDSQCDSTMTTCTDPL